jgi:metal-dependent hydrolase (beta-lactamase superfamily II)
MCGRMPQRADLVGEWGLSMHAQSQRGSELRNVLIDFGYMPETINNNVSVLKLDPAEIDAHVRNSRGAIRHPRPQGDHRRGP